MAPGLENTWVSTRKMWYHWCPGAYGFSYTPQPRLRSIWSTACWAILATWARDVRDLRSQHPGLKRRLYAQERRWNCNHPSPIASSRRPGSKTGGQSCKGRQQKEYKRLHSLSRGGRGQPFHEEVCGASTLKAQVLRSTKVLNRITGAQVGVV